MAQSISRSNFLLSSLTVFILLLMTYETYSHTMGLGSCPRVDPIKDFDMEKFMGSWYVVEKFSTSSSCMKYNFTFSDGKMKLIQTRQHFILDTIGVDHIYTYTGVLSVPDNDNKARMRVKFPLNIAGDAEFIVYATDYANYGAIFTCQKILFGHTKSATILSRKPTLDRSIINQMRQQLEEFGVDPDDFSIVDQEKCINSDTANLNVKIDDNLFSSKNVAGVVKKVGGAIGTGLEKAGDFLGTGVHLATNITSTIVESMGDNKEVKHKDLMELLNRANIRDNDAELLP